MMVIPNRVRVVAVISALALAIGVLTLALLANPTQAQPPTDKENRGATSERTPISGTFEACSGEVISFEGTQHWVTHYWADEEGQYHLNSHYGLNVSGVGLTSGDKYVITTDGAFVENYIPASGQVNTGDVGIRLVIRNGSDASEDDLLGTSVVHYIVYDDGTVKMEMGQAQFKCQ
jgi:hypothetical protein